jgi:hypothetical protein
MGVSVGAGVAVGAGVSVGLGAIVGGVVAVGFAAEAHAPSTSAATISSEKTVRRFIEFLLYFCLLYLYILYRYYLITAYILHNICTMSI